MSLRERKTSWFILKKVPETKLYILPGAVQCYRHKLSAREYGRAQIVFVWTADDQSNKHFSPCCQSLHEHFNRRSTITPNIPVIVLTARTAPCQPSICWYTHTRTRSPRRTTQSLSSLSISAGPFKRSIIVCFCSCPVYAFRSVLHSIVRFVS